jgi:hypothetical protein
MIPSLEELRKRLVPDLASDSALSRNPRRPKQSAHSVRLSSPEFPVLCHPLPLFASDRRLMCRLCLRRPEPAIILRPKYLRPRPSQIIRSSLEGWLKHDFVFFGESCLCERCAKAGGLILDTAETVCTQSI